MRELLHKELVDIFVERIILGVALVT